MTDVLERLREANPVTDLDAVRLGVAPLPRAPKHRRRRAALALAGGSILAGAVVLTGLHDSPATEVPATPRRALGPGNSILHVVTRTTQEGHATGSSSEELWIGPDG